MAPVRDTQRIAKLLARAGIASRREVERMIAEGRIAIDGKTVETPATLLASLHGVTVDGSPVKAAAPARLFRYHKPAGLLTAERDPQGRPTIYDRLPADLPRLVPVGRLDMNTEGLLLLTTDGGLKRQLELPATGVERIYRARTFGEISQDRLESLIEGIEIEGMRYGPIDANLERRTGRNQWIEMRLREGKNREVRRVLEHLGLQVSRLIRTAYGPFALGDLAPGAVDEIRQHDLVAFRKALDLPAGADALSARAAPRGAPPDRESRRPPRPPRADQKVRPASPARTPRDDKDRRRDARVQPAARAEPGRRWEKDARPSSDAAGRGRARPSAATTPNRRERFGDNGSDRKPKAADGARGKARGPVRNSAGDRARSSESRQGPRDRKIEAKRPEGDRRDTLRAKGPASRASSSRGAPGERSERPGAGRQPGTGRPSGSRPNRGPGGASGKSPRSPRPPRG